MDSKVREALVELGAPLGGAEPVPHFSPEDTLVLAIGLARSDGTIFRVLPLVLARTEALLDWAALKERAREAGVQAELGVLVSLAADAASRPSLAYRVADLREDPVTPRGYFPEVRSSFERALAADRTPSIARAWGFLMNVSSDSLRSFVAKHGA